MAFLKAKLGIKKHDKKDGYFRTNTVLGETGAPTSCRTVLPERLVLIHD